MFLLIYDILEEVFICRIIIFLAILYGEQNAHLINIWIIGCEAACIKLKVVGFFIVLKNFIELKLPYLCAALNYKYPQFSATSTKKAWYS